MKCPDRRPLIAKQKLKEPSAPTSHPSVLGGVDDKLSDVVAQIIMVDLKPLDLCRLQNERGIDRIEIPSSNRDMVDVLRHAIDPDVAVEIDERHFLDLNAQENHLLGKDVKTAIQRRERGGHSNSRSREEHAGAS